jgi:DNA uptake protein ComE-like DNA-binding protein
VNAAGRDELTKLPGVTPEAAGRLVEARGKNGRFKTSEEVREALGMNAADFEKVCYLLSLK